MTADINAALVELQANLPRITKDLTAKVKTRTGSDYQYNYADLAVISREVLPLLSGLGLAFTSRPTLKDGRFVLVYELRHKSGGMIDGEYPLPEKGEQQDIGSAITYARRYSLCAVTGVAPDDDDRDAIVQQKAARRRNRQQQEPTAAPKVQPMNSGQQKRIQDLFGQVGLEDRDDRLRYAVEVVGRPLKSATDLSFDEASRVIDKLEDWAEQSEPPAGGES